MKTADWPLFYAVAIHKRFTKSAKKGIIVNETKVRNFAPHQPSQASGMSCARQLEDFVYRALLDQLELASESKFGQVQLRVAHPPWYTSSRMREQYRVATTRLSDLSITTRFEGWTIEIIIEVKSPSLRDQFVGALTCYGYTQYEQPSSSLLMFLAQPAPVEAS